MRKILQIAVIIFFVLIIFGVNYITGFLYPYIPFYNYNGITPPNDSWKSCAGTISHMNGREAQSDNMKKFDYWTVRAIKENNPSFCRNVGIYEGGDVIYSDEHKHAVRVCNYIIQNNPSFVKQCQNVH